MISAIVSILTFTQVYVFVIGPYPTVDLCEADLVRLRIAAIEMVSDLTTAPMAGASTSCREESEL